MRSSKVRVCAALAAFLLTCLWAGSGQAALPAVSAGPGEGGEAKVSARVLALIDAGNAAAVSALGPAGAEVHWRSELYILAAVAEPQLALLGDEAQVLDRDPWSAGGDYYWVLVRGRERIALEAVTGIEVLFTDGKRSLIQAARADAESLPQLGYEIARVPRTALPLPGTTEPAPTPTAPQEQGPASAGSPGSAPSLAGPPGEEPLPAAPRLPALSAPGSREFDAVIDEIVAAVSQSQYTTYIQTLEDFGTRYSYSDGILEAADWIFDTFQGFGLDVERHAFSLSPLTRENIIATKTGTLYPDEVVFITAHYDCTSESPETLAPGADDNGSGTAAVIEAARVLSAYDCQRTVKFACFAGEEQGLYGSFAYVGDEVAGSGLEVVGVYNLDMIAWSGSDPAPPDLIIYRDDSSTAIAEELRDAALHYVPEDVEPVIVYDPGMWASDHAAFWNYGYPAILGIEEEAWGADFNPYYHSTQDTVAHCDLEYATAVTRAGVAALADLAGAQVSSVPFLVTGAGPAYGNPPVVRVFPPAQDASHQYEFSPYSPLHYGVNVAAGDVDGGTGVEILSGAGPGAIYGPHVRGFRADGTPLPGLSFLAYGTHKFGVHVAAGDLDGNGMDEIVTGAGPGAVFGPHVRAFGYDAAVPSVSPVPGVSFLAYGTHKWGVHVAAGDLDGDGMAEILTGAGPGTVFGPHVRGWNVDGGTAQPIPAASFLAYGTHQFGVRVAAGDVDGDGMAEILTAPGPSAAFGAQVRGWNFDGAAITPLPGLDFLAWPAAEARYGARVASGADLDGDQRDEVIVGAGPDPAVGSPVKVFLYDGSAVTLWFSLEAYPAGWTQGTSVAAGRF